MGVSITELIIIFLVLLIVFGPEQLPVFARQFGKIMGEVKKGSDAVRREFYNSVYTPADEVKRDILGDSRNLKALKAELFAPPTGAHPSKDPRKAEPRPTEQPSDSEPRPTASDPTSSALKGEQPE